MMVALRAFAFACLFFFPCTLGKPEYKIHAEAGLKALQKWYNTTTGLWETTGWWNGGNCLTTIANFAAFNEYAASVADTVFPTSFTHGQNTNLLFRKSILPNGLVDTGYLKFSTSDSHLRRRGFLASLMIITTMRVDMVGGWDDNRCGGGIWWDKNKTALVAIANELFLSVAAHLATRVHDHTKYYYNWATKEWNWFKKTGMINERNNINDGVELKTCQNNNGKVWSYNQGVILGALVEFAKASYPVDASLIDQAHAIATAAIGTLADKKGILHDPCEPDCGADGPQFKGIFMRNLQILHEASPRAKYKTFIKKNAHSIWKNDRNEMDQFGVNWAGPFEPPALASSQSSALDALVAAAAMWE
ncbi:hypothetical protein ACJ72_00442 [Emergomyces africanus]|uniref:Mannan endo-1,6-alpha-mannosidase n=1 Tax=Emergomyces africanus TaxID=1955775 RepID=A0A1B7P813_9EURO|nr:hypothetical protein ACJ72_00442 [Emergomyces africanus]